MAATQDMETLKSTDFRVQIDPLVGKQSEGKWDYRVIVTRLTDGMTKTERVSGGWKTADYYANKLAHDLGLPTDQWL